MSQSVSFFDLPRNLRLKIYDQIGLIRPCPININSEGNRTRENEICLAAMAAGGAAATAAYPNQLVLVGPAAANPIVPQAAEMDELCSYITKRDSNYNVSINRHDIRCYCPRLPYELLLVCQGFHNKIVPILYGRNKFTVDCVAGHQRLYHMSSKAVSLMTCLHVDLKAPGVLKDHIQSPKSWLKLCNFLAVNIDRSTLSMSVASNLTRIDVADLITSPLKKLRPLKSCAISLHKGLHITRIGTPEEGLGRMIQDTATYLTTKQSRNLDAPFRFSDLPAELQREILYQSDLVVIEDPCEPHQQGLLIHRSMAIFSHRCCLKCSPGLEICYCHKVQSAFSTTCTCVSVPTALFRVSKSMRNEAYQVFYSKNRFIFEGSFDGAIAWLANRSCSQLQLLRKIYIAVEPHQIQDWNNETSRQWVGLVDFIQRNLDISRLSLTIDSSDGHDLDLMSSTVVKARYGLMFNELYKLRGLSGFKTHLNESAVYAEEEVEQDLMGVRYKSSKEGRDERRLGWPYYPAGRMHR